MSEPRVNRDSLEKSAHRAAEDVPYPVDHVVGVLDTAERLDSALNALISGGFLNSEVDVLCGPATADSLHATTGRTGLSGGVLRIGQRLGLPSDELVMRERYEDAIRDGRFVVAVLTPTNERKDLAAQRLRDHGGHFISFLGRYTFEEIER